MCVITAHFSSNCWVISLKLTHNWWTVPTTHSLITAPALVCLKSRKAKSRKFAF